MLRLSLAGRTVLEHFEGRRREAYPDPATGGEPWTIGVGHTGPGIRKGLVWSQEQIDQALSADLDRFEREVNALLGGHPVTQGQFDALVLFAFNVGSDIDEDTKAEGLGDSTLLRKLLANDVRGAAAEFPKWDKAAGRSMRGLRRRRAAEQALFLGATVASALTIAAGTP